MSAAAFFPLTEAAILLRPCLQVPSQPGLPVPGSLTWHESKQVLAAAASPAISFSVSCLETRAWLQACALKPLLSSERCKQRIPLLPFGLGFPLSWRSHHAVCLWCYYLKSPPRDPLCSCLSVCLSMAQITFPRNTLLLQ